MRVIITCLFFSIISFAVKAQMLRINGYVTDIKTREVLIGATISNNEASSGVTTNSYGFFSFEHPKGNLQLLCSYIGYETVVIDLSLSKDTTINIPLSPIIFEISDVEIKVNKSNIRMDKGLGIITVPISTIKNTPKLFGESDLMKSLQFIPGVQQTAEGKSNLTIRGGSPDQNLILLDGIPIYNADHAFGFLSVFNTEALKNVTLYKSGYPARFGGRLSSVIDINTKDGNKEAFAGSATLGLLAGSVIFEGPIVKDRTSFFFSARRSLIDLYLMGLQELANADDFETNRTNFSFYDINAKIHHKISDKTSIYTMVYNGRDKLMNRTGNNDLSVSQDDIPDRNGNSVQNNIPNEEISNSVSEQDWKWGNTIYAIRLNSAVASNMFLNTTFAYNKYQYKTTVDKSYANDSVNVIDALNYSSGVNDYSISLNCEYTPSNKHFLRSGFQFIYHDFFPEILLVHSSGNEATTPNTQPSQEILSREYSFYIEDKWSISKKLEANIGTRFSLFNVDGVMYNAFDPRLSLRYMLTNKLSIVADYTHMEQYIHMLSNNSLLLQTDLWVSSTSSIKPMRARQLSFGVNQSIASQLTLSFASYYKNMNNVIEYKEGASFSGTSSGWEDKVESGIGRAYGAEFALEKNLGKTTGTLSYTLSKTERKFNKINSGDWFPSKYDRRHYINLLVMHKLNSKIDFTLNWVYSSGNMMTIPVMSVVTPDIPYYPGKFDELTQLENRNNYRMPAYHRLDVGVNYTRKKTKYKCGIWNFSIYNIYNQMNAFKLYEEVDVSRNDVGKLVYTKKLKQVTLFPIIPSISYMYKF
jgi:hypothetical protein